MWQKLICLIYQKDNVPCQLIKLGQLQQRVPPNQQKHFLEFAKKNEIYKSRVYKYPERLPKIDWKYYRASVREGYRDWVDHFEKKYHNMNTIYDGRHEMIDLAVYFAPIDKEKDEVTKQVAEFKAASNKRIREYEAQIKVLKELKPYSDMTMEEFCDAYPEVAPDFRNRPTFWPHTPEEQRPGPSVLPKTADDDDSSPKSIEGKSPPTGVVPPPPPAGTAPPAPISVVPPQASPTVGSGPAQASPTAGAEPAQAAAKPKDKPLPAVPPAASTKPSDAQQGSAKGPAKESETARAAGDKRASESTMRAAEPSTVAAAAADDDEVCTIFTMPDSTDDEKAPNADTGDKTEEKKKPCPCGDKSTKNEPKEMPAGSGKHDPKFAKIDAETEMLCKAERFETVVTRMPTAAGKNSEDGSCKDLPSAKPEPKQKDEQQKSKPIEGERKSRVEVPAEEMPKGETSKLETGKVETVMNKSQVKPNVVSKTTVSKPVCEQFEPCPESVCEPQPEALLEHSPESVAEPCPESVCAPQPETLTICKESNAEKVELNPVESIDMDKPADELIERNEEPEQPAKEEDEPEEALIKTIVTDKPLKPLKLKQTNELGGLYDCKPLQLPPTSGTKEPPMVVKKSAASPHIDKHTIIKGAAQTTSDVKEAHTDKGIEGDDIRKHSIVTSAGESCTETIADVDVVKRNESENICRKSVIKGEAEQAADVKPQHAQLRVESPSDYDIIIVKSKLDKTKKAESVGDDGVKQEHDGTDCQPTATANAKSESDKEAQLFADASSEPVYVDCLTDENLRRMQAARTPPTAVDGQQQPSAVLFESETPGEGKRQIKDIPPVTFVKKTIELDCKQMDVTTDGIDAVDVQRLAYGISQLLDNAKQSFDQAKLIHKDRIKVLEEVTMHTAQLADRAIAEATKAVKAAQKLIKRAEHDANPQDNKLMKMAQKHAQLANFLEERALKLKEETSKVLEEIKVKKLAHVDITNKPNKS